MAALLLLWSVPNAAADTPTIAGGDCWQATTPLTCTTHWAGANTFDYFYVENDVGSSAPSWATGIQAAANAWSDFPGPQILATTYDSSHNPITTHVYYSQTGDNGLNSSDYGVTWLCPQSGPCIDVVQATDIWYSKIFLNHYAIDGTPGACFNVAVEHELGHIAWGSHITPPEGPVLWFPR